jgi:hypothetical protein
MNHRKIASLIFLCAFVSTTFGALKFNGSTSYMRIPYQSWLDFHNAGSPFTACMWIYYDGSMPDCAIISQFRNTPSNYSGWMIWTGGGASTSFKAYINTGIRAQYTLSGIGWHHIALVYDTTNYYLYDNGVFKVNSAGYSTPPNNASNDIIVGGYYNFGNDTGGTPTFLWDDQLDDPRIYNRALSANELLTIARSGVRKIVTAGRVGQWPLDEGKSGQPASGTVARDVSGFNNTATLVGGSTWKGSPVVSYE